MILPLTQMKESGKNKLYLKNTPQRKPRKPTFILVVNWHSCDSYSLDSFVSCLLAQWKFPRRKRNEEPHRHNSVLQGKKEKVEEGGAGHPGILWESKHVLDNHSACRRRRASRPVQRGWKCLSLLGKRWLSSFIQGHPESSMCTNRRPSVGPQARGG